MTINQSTKPDNFLLIIGAMKSGTTSLFDLLKQHPEISACRKKEPDFYSNTDDPTSEWGKYLNLWEWLPEQHKIAMEASTSYSKAPLIDGVPEKIHSSPNSRFKFIYILRDPIKRISSQVRHAIYEGWGKSLDDEFTDDLIYFTQYSMQLDNYLNIFSRDDFLLITLEEFKNDPELILTNVCNFLKISNDFTFTNIDVPRNTGDFYNIHPLFSSLLKNTVVKAISDFLIRGSIRTQLRRIISRFGHTEHTIGRSKLNDMEIKSIYEQLAPDLHKLSTVYNVDVHKYWSIPDDLES